MEAVVKRSRGVSAQLNGGVGYLLKKNKVDVIWGEAKIAKAPKGGPVEVTVGQMKKPVVEPQNPVPKGVLGEGTYAAKNVIVATGARPRVLPGIEPDGDRIWTYFEAMKPKAMPKSLIVMGSGAIGIEFASLLPTMGADVTVVELLPQILPVEDAEIAGVARKRFEKQGIKILTDAKVNKVDQGKDGVEVHVETKDGKSQTLKAERLISAVGVQGNIEGLGLEEAGVQIERGLVKIDPHGKTNVAGIYAIGDVSGPPMLAHKAEHEGTICVEAIKGMHPHPMEKTQIPGLHLLPAADRLRGTDRSQGERSGPRGQGRALQLQGQRQGHRARRAGGPGQDGVRRQDRRTSGRPHGRRRGHRADPGLRHRHGARDHRGRPDAHGLPASDPVGDDARERRSTPIGRSFTCDGWSFLQRRPDWSGRASNVPMRLAR